MPYASLIHLARDVLDFCYPGRCANCASDCAGHSPLCDDCAERLTVLEAGPACERCAMPLAQEGDPCPYCLGKGSRPYAYIARLAVFHDPLRHVIHRMKYHGRWPLGQFLGERLRAQPAVRRVLAEADCLLPVPLHRLRQMSRGYNQADVIARTLAGSPWPWLRGSGSPKRLRIVHPLIRLRHTETQTHQHTRAQREQNLRDAFGLVHPAAVRGKRVVVVDDVLTTGATLRAVARALRPARPASLSAIVIAIADPIGRDFQRINPRRVEIPADASK